MLHSLMMSICNFDMQLCLATRFQASASLGSTLNYSCTCANNHCFDVGKQPHA